MNGPIYLRNCERRSSVIISSKLLQLLSPSDLSFSIMLHQRRISLMISSHIKTLFDIFLALVIGSMIVKQSGFFSGKGKNGLEAVKSRYLLKTRGFMGDSKCINYLLSGRPRSIPIFLQSKSLA